MKFFNAKKVNEGFNYNSKTNSIFETVGSLKEKIKIEFQHTFNFFINE